MKEERVLSSEEFKASVLNLKKLEEGDPLHKVSCDILRSLVILYGSAWESNLSDTLAVLWSLRSLSRDESSKLEKLLPKGIELLNGKGLIISEKRLRADLSQAEPIEDVLHRVEHLSSLIQLFSSDREIERYRREIMGYSSLKFG